tara:strand:+ start:10582 stop:10890 length:309 start_codon:yes stop_codon:yes gene_type:complete
MTYDPDKLTSGDEIRYLRNYIDRNKLEMSLLSDAIDELEDILGQQGYWFKQRGKKHEIVFTEIKSLKKRLEEELTKKSLKSLELKNEHGELLASLMEAGEWE